MLHLDMEIKITGAKHAPSWEALQTVIRTSLADDTGRITRINRRDGGCSYRDKGTYDLTYIPEVGDAIQIVLIVE